MNISNLSNAQSHIRESLKRFREEEEEMLLECDEACLISYNNKPKVHFNYTFRFYNMYSFLRQMHRFKDDLRNVTSFEIKVDMQDTPELQMLVNKYYSRFIKEVIDIIQDSNRQRELYIGFEGVSETCFAEVLKYIHGDTCITRFGVTNMPDCDKQQSHLYLEDLLKKSCIKDILLRLEEFTPEERLYFNRLAEVDIEEREIPIRSNTKSAAKLSKTI